MRRSSGVKVKLFLLFKENSLEGYLLSGSIRSVEENRVAIFE